MKSHKTHIKPFLAMVINDEAKEMERKGLNVIRFSLGEPDFKSPKAVKEACIQAIRHDITKYEHSQGLIELRDVIAKHYKKKYGVKVDPAQILITPGTSQALFLTFTVLLEKGDEVILPNPHYPSDLGFIEYAGGKSVFLPVKEKEGYHWDLGRLKKLIHHKTKCFLVTSPSNPTGSLVRPEVFRFLAKTGKYIVSDEIYHGLTFQGKEHTALEFTKNCFVVNGFSKAYSMTGYRLGYVIAPKKFIPEMINLQQNFYISVNSFVQIAGIAAIQKAQADVTKMCREFKKRRDLMIDGLKKIGFPISYVPEGAFYIMAKADHLDKNSFLLSKDILKNAHVAVTPGIDFGSEGEGYLRFSFAVDEKKIREGLKRLKIYLKNKTQQ